MLSLRVKLWLTTIATVYVLEGVQGTNLRLRKVLLSSGDWLNDVDGDNIPGRSGIDYPVYASVPEETRFRCNNYDYAGYFADVDADCQAYHVCFPDGRNASFLCVNGTVFHQRYFVCDWWFHSNCSLAPELYDLNLYRKIPLPVLPPVKRRPFPGPAPQPDVVISPRQREPKNMNENPKTDRRDKNPYERRDKGPYEGNKDTNERDRKPNERRDKDSNEKRDRDPYERRDKDPYERRDGDPRDRKEKDPFERKDKEPYDRRDRGPYERKDKEPYDRRDRGQGKDKPYERRDKDFNDKKKLKDNFSPVPPNDKRVNKKPPTWGRGRDDTCDCRCDSPGSMYAASAVEYDELHEIV